MLTDLAFLFRSPRLIFLLQTGLVLWLLAAGCSDPALEMAAVECVTDQDCSESSPAWACNRQGECFECGHEDPDNAPVETPEFWDPDQFTSGEELGLDSQLAYWELEFEAYGEYGVIGQPTPWVWLCVRATVEAGEIVATGTACDSLDAKDFIYSGASLIVPVAPSPWLSSDPLDGSYYTEVHYEFGPIYLCDEGR